MAGEPAGRGPMVTSCRRCSHARPESNFGAGACAKVVAASKTTINAELAELAEKTPLCVFCGFRVDLPRPRDLLLRIEQHFLPLGDPAGRPGNREQDGEHLHRKTHGLVNEPGIEIDVWIELAADEIVVLQGDPLELERNVEERI